MVWLKSDMSRHILEELELGLGSGGRIRILFTLADKPEKAYTKYALEQITGLKAVEVRRQLKILTQLGWVKVASREPEIYQLNLENKIVKDLLQFLKRVKIP